MSASTTGTRWAKAYCEEQSDQAINHHLSLSTAESGHLFINGLLDPVGGAAVRTALEPLAQKSGAHDHRLLPQRYADALVELASAGKPANLQVTATIETLKGLAGAADGLRLQRDASSVERGVGDDRRRPEQAGDLEHVAQGAQNSRWPLQVAGLRATGILVRWSSPGALDPRGRDQSR